MSAPKLNTGRLYNKHSALGYLLVQERGFHELIESVIESIDDHITDNLRRDSDEENIEFLRRKQDELKRLL